MSRWRNLRLNWPRGSSRLASAERAALVERRAPHPDRCISSNRNLSPTGAAERIRQKIAASKKRGMWMGGPVPLGCEDKDRKLIVVPGEACTVRDIMQHYLRSDGVPSPVEEPERDGIAGKRRIMRNGSIEGGTPFRRGALAHLISNRIYLELITHKGKSYAALRTAESVGPKAWGRKLGSTDRCRGVAGGNGNKNGTQTRTIQARAKGEESTITVFSRLSP